MTAPDTASSPPVPEPRTHRFEFSGAGSTFFLIFLKNVLLTLVTFGAYLAWGKTERRRYVWSNLSFDGQPLRYTGTGLELFKGYVVVLVGYILFFSLPELIGGFVPGGVATAQLVLFVGFFLVAPFLIYRSRAVLYNRTVWRGIRFGMEKAGARTYAKRFLVGGVQILLTVGLFSPVVSNRLYRTIVDNTRFGSLELHYTGTDREALLLGLKGLVLTVLTLGIYWFWYSAERMRFQLGHTRVGEAATLRCDVTGATMFGLSLLNIFGTTLTLGLAFPWITMYSIRVMARHVVVEGVIDFDAIEQRAREAGATSDGFADAFDLDLGL